MALVRDKAASGRELLHRVALLLASDLPLHDLVEKSALVLGSALGGASIHVVLRREGRPFIERGAPLGPNALAVPILGGAGEIGVLHAMWPHGAEPDDYDVTLLEAAAMQLGSRALREFEREERERLLQLAATDALTGLANRRTFDETLAREWARCARSERPLSLLMLDVDFFKLYNDAYGHVAGDRCLQRVARAIASCVKRPGDVACRYGGEEFAVILPETAPGDAMRVAQQICDAVRSEQIAHQGSSLGYATVSIGCAGVEPQSGVDHAALTTAADEQLYRAKEHGRNRAAWADALSEAPAAERQTGPRSNLPTPQNLFFGRDGDLDVMAALMRDARLLSIVGPGGVGKTRLAIEFARRHAARFADGVYFVDLASLSEGSFVTPEILAVLGVPEAARRDADELLAAHLTDKHALIVLDNCEHLADRVAILLERLVASTPGPSFVVTARRSLRVEGEQVYRLATLQQGDAVALFASRAQAALPSFGLDAQNIETIKAICTELNGIPLAIELAAARVRVLPLGELRTEFAERAQRRTVDDTIEWSYGILGADEQTLLRRLAVFAGAFTLDAAQAICAYDADFDLIDLLGRLSDKSLVQSDPVAGRYWLLESTREFGRRLLESRGEYDPLRARYLDALATMARDAEKLFAHGAGDDVRASVVATYADFRAAMEWALAGGGDVRQGAALVAALGWYWTEGGLWREARYWLDLALRHTLDEMGSALAARLLLASAVAYYVQGEFAAMGTEARRCYDAYRSHDDRIGMASAQNLMAIEAQFSGRLNDAYELWQSVLQASREAGNARFEAVVLGNLAEVVAEWKRDYAESEHLYERASAIHRRLSNSFPLGVTLGDWSVTAAYQGDLRRAERLATEALEIFRGFDEEMRVVEQLIRIAQYRIWAGRIDEAKRTLREVFERLSSGANPLYAARAAESLAELAAAQERSAEAASFLAYADALRRDQRLVRPAQIVERLATLRARLAAVARTPDEREFFALAHELIRRAH